MKTYAFRLNLINEDRAHQLTFDIHGGRIRQVPDDTLKPLA